MAALGSASPRRLAQHLNRLRHDPGQAQTHSLQLIRSRPSNRTSAPLRHPRQRPAAGRSYREPKSGKAAAKITAKEWFTSKRKISPTTRRDYRDLFDNYVIPKWRDWQVSAIRGGRARLADQARDQARQVREAPRVRADHQGLPGAVDGDEARRVLEAHQHEPVSRPRTPAIGR